MSREPTTENDSRLEERPGNKTSLPREVIESLPEELRDESPEKITEYFLSVERIRSPVIPPWLLNQYSKEVQAVIVGEVPEHRRHRTKLESKRQILSFVFDVLKLASALISVVILLTGSIDIIKSGQSAEGLIGIGGTVTLVVGAFLYRDHNRRMDRREREAPQNPPQVPQLEEGGDNK